MVGDSAGGNTDLGSGRGKRVFKAVILSQGQLKIMSNKCQLVKVTQTSCTYVLVPNIAECVRHQSFVKKMLYFLFINPSLLDHTRAFSSRWCLKTSTLNRKKLLSLLLSRLDTTLLGTWVCNFVPRRHVQLTKRISSTCWRRAFLFPQNCFVAQNIS